MELLSDSDYDNREFKNISLKQSPLLQTEFQNCSFNRCDLSQSILTECRFYDCIFHSCDLSLIKPKGSYFRNSVFSNSKLIGINWVESESPFSVDFKDCILNLSSFFGMNLKKRKFINCVAHEVDFSDCNMTDCDCSLTDFLGSTFLSTNLTRANFSSAKNYAIDFRSNILSKTKFSLPEAICLLDNLDIIITE